MLSNSHALMIPCSCAIVLSCSHALVRLQTRSYISIDCSLRSTYIPLSIADERAKRASKAVSCCHLIVVACSWAAALTHDHVLMNSCSRAPALMPSCYRSPTLSKKRGSGNALFFFVIPLIFSSALTLSQVPLPSHAKAYVPSVTRFPSLFVQVAQIMPPLWRNGHV